MSNIQTRQRSSFISVYVSTETASKDDMVLYADYPNLHEAHAAVERAIAEGYHFAKLVTETLYESKVEAPATYFALAERDIRAEQARLGSQLSNGERYTLLKRNFNISAAQTRALVRHIAEHGFVNYR